MTGVITSLRGQFFAPAAILIMIMIMTSGRGLQQRPTSPITKKYSTLKIKMDNEAVQMLHTS